MRHFEWKGEPIKDINKFCVEHNCELVKLRVKRSELSLSGHRIVVSNEIEFWPSLFFDNLRISYAGSEQMNTKEIERISPSKL